MKLKRLNRLTARRAVALASVTAAVAAAALLSAFPTSADTASSANTQHSEATKPTVVLIHGAFADSSSWNGVIERLQAAGIQVTAAPNPLRGISHDSAYVASFLKQVPGPVLAVGHSYGGAVISNAATGLGNVVGLVFVAAFAPTRASAWPT